MARSYRLLLLLIPAIALLVSCGGGDDDDNGDDASGDPGSSVTLSQKSSNGGDAKIPKLKDASFASGKVHVEVSGDKDFKTDLDGSGVVLGGFAVFTYGSNDASVILSFQSADSEAPGALSLTTPQLSTAGEWGKDCTVSIDEGSTELKGEFTCKELNAIDAKSAKDYKIRVSGKFSAQR